MTDINKERERAQLERLRKTMPLIAFGLSFLAFVVSKFAGSATWDSVLMAAFMFTFVYGTFAMRALFGVKGFIIALLTLAVIGVLAQSSGWI